MPGSMPATSQLDWLISMTAMIVLFWSRATRDLLKSFGWGIAALHWLHAATKLPFPRRPPHSVYRSPIEATIFRDRPEARRRQTCERLRSLQWIDVDMSAGRRGPIVHAEDEVREHECRLAVRQRHEGERRVAERFCSAGEQG